MRIEPISRFQMAPNFLSRIGLEFQLRFPPLFQFVPKWLRHSRVAILQGGGGLTNQQRIQNGGVQHQTPQDTRTLF